MIIFKDIQKQKLPKKQIGNVEYYHLKENNKLNIINNKKALIIILVAFILSSIFIISQIATNVINDQNIKSNLSNMQKLEVPLIASCLNKTNKQLDKEFDSMIPLRTHSEDTYDKFRAPEHNDKSNTILLKGLNNLSAAEITYIYNGGWQLTVDRTSKPFARLRYIDFSSNSEEEAINKAITIQKFDETNKSDVKNDEAGNTYCDGTSKYKNSNIRWRVSVIKYNEISNIGLPDNSFYVAIRVE